MSQEVEIWIADWIFTFKDGKTTYPYICKNIVTPRIPEFVLTSDDFYIDRALPEGMKTLKKNLSKDKNGRYIIKIKFIKHISNSFADYNQTTN